MNSHLSETDFKQNRANRVTLVEGVYVHYDLHKMFDTFNHSNTKQPLSLRPLFFGVSVVARRAFQFLTLGLMDCVGSSGRLDDHLLFDILKEKLNSKPCRNQGFVLDGFLKTYEQAKLIFYGKFQPFI